MGGHEILQSPTLEGRGTRRSVERDRCLQRDGATVASRSLTPKIRVRIPVPLMWQQALIWRLCRNWQTNAPQKRVGERPCGFDSHQPHWTFALFAVVAELAYAPG